MVVCVAVPMIVRVVVSTAVGLRVQHLLTPGSVLLRPTMIARVLRASRRDRRAALAGSVPSAAGPVL